MKWLQVQGFFSRQASVWGHKLYFLTLRLIDSSVWLVEWVTVFLPSVSKPLCLYCCCEEAHADRLFFTAIFFLETAVQFTAFHGGLTCQLDVIDSNRRAVAVNVIMRGPWNHTQRNVREKCNKYSVSLHATKELINRNHDSVSDL